MVDCRAEKPSADIAIIGMACLFPGAKDLRRYWQNICRRHDAVGTVPPQRWRVEDFFSEDRLARDRVYSRWGAFLDEFRFDPVKWHIPPASLRHIEPMQLLSLEVAWRAMVDAGYFQDRADSPVTPNAELRTPSWKERAGVLFAVPGSHELGTAYCFRTMMRHYLPQVRELSPELRQRIYRSLEEKLPEWSEDSFPGFLGNVIAGRIAREFDFHGPNFTVDAACAASLAALFTAVEFLRGGTSDLMLVGGTDGTNNPFGFMSFARTHALSPRGKSFAFDAHGDGIALGEGVAVVVLKRLEDAQRDGDKIYALIKGVGSSSDGKNKSLTAPHPPGQMRAVERAYEDAGVSPASVTLIEAHGTGTAVGDCAELKTLAQVFAPHTQERQYVAVGSVKSMIGHTKTVAGLASLIKTTLALQQRVLPPTINVEKPSNSIDLANSPFYLNTATRPWLVEQADLARRAGVSAFGFGGTNFHVVLEEYPERVNSDAVPNWMPRSAEVFFFECATNEELLRELGHFQRQIEQVPNVDLADLAASVWQTKRSDPSRAARLAVVASSLTDLKQKIHKVLASLPDRPEVNDPSGIYCSRSAPSRDSQVCFLYPGQGSQAVNMLRDLVTGSPWSHELFREATSLLGDELSHPLSRCIYPPPVFTEAERERQAALMCDTRLAQPALGVVELFATDLLERFGIRPTFVAGHSYGEHVALHVAGCLSRADLLRLSAYRGRVCAEATAVCPGAMASVQADATTTEKLLRDLNLSVFVANRNSPEQTVVAGSTKALEAFIEHLTRRGVRSRKLSVPAAFHTPLLASASRTMAEYWSRIAVEPPRLPVYSNTTAKRHADHPVCIRELLARHLSEPVLFEQEIRQLYADGARVFVEVGPGRVLTDLVSRILTREPVTALSLDSPGREGWTQLGHLLARLFVLGVSMRPAAWFEGRGLTANTLSDFLDQTRAANTPKATDWMLHPNKAEPISPVTQPRQTEPEKVNGSRMDSPKPILHTEKVLPAMIATNGESKPAASTPIAAASVHELFAQFQETTRLLLEAQQAQNRVLERYLETQERLLLHCTQQDTLQPAMATSPKPPIPAVPPVRPPVPIPRPVSTSTALKPSVPVIPSVVAVERSKNGIASNGETMTVHVNGVVSTNGEGPPPTETFRHDLLEAVSSRTGYPIDALDENLALEAELGIDSIKTVEIFSNLRAYHPYFRLEEQQEEELLAEFTRLKSLRDIIEAYERRRKTHLAVPYRNGTTNSDDSDAVRVEQTKVPIQRLSVTSVAAPQKTSDEKKNGLRDVSS